jgi:small GTP-binding protein
MLKKKICMLGVYGVGKTSLVRSFVFSIFEDKYHSTVGVKIDKRVVDLQGQQIEFLLWDIAGEDDHFSVPPSYLRGAAGYLLVVDGTRQATLERALDLQRRTEEATGPVPFILVLNKADLTDRWELDPGTLAGLEKRRWPMIKTSAKLGTGVEEAFLELGRKILAGS